MAKQTSSKSSPNTASGASNSKQTGEASTPITKVISKAAEQAASTAKSAVESVQTAVQNANVNKGEGLLPSEPSMLTVKPAPTHAEIAKRAYEISQQRGGGQGNEHDDWVQAEKDLLD